MWSMTQYKARRIDLNWRCEYIIQRQTYAEIEKLEMIQSNSKGE